MADAADGGAQTGTGRGPLAGFRFLEFAGLGPGPFCGMLLSDLGADVVRIDRPDTPAQQPHQVTHRGRRSVALNLKDPRAVELCFQLAEQADGLFEGFRPGVMERLGLGPEPMLARNPRLVYGRMTGWGQDGPLASAAGHDINYIALTGALAAIGTRERPVAPLNLIGDFGGGALYLAMGLLAGVLSAQRTGRGQVVDAAMVDGAASLMAYFYGFRAAGTHGPERASNRLDGGAPFYDAYRCADGEWVALGSIEPQFYALLRDKAGLTDPLFDAQLDRSQWPAQKARLAEVMATRTRAEWCALMEGTDVCFAPVLELGEAPSHPHNVARGTFVTVEGVVQPAPAPRFSATPAPTPAPPPQAGAHNREALLDWGLPEDKVAALAAEGVI